MIALRMEASSAYYRRLDAGKIIETVQALHQRVERRFPGSGLGKVVAELLQVAQETVTRAHWIQKPNIPIRAAAVLLSLAILTIIAGLVVNIRQFSFTEYGTFIQALDASIGSVVFIGAAILFLVNWENRIKRGRALKAVHELRALAHIVDMHQVTKDPERYVGRRASAAVKREMTPFELGRYLDYCADSLALISKIAALYVQDFQDTVLLDAVDDVEELTSGLSRKIWQKLTILGNLIEAMPPEDAAP